MSRANQLMAQLFIELGLKVEKIDESSFELFIQAKPSAKKERLSLSDQGHLKVYISSPPVEGAANKAIVKFLSKKWSISKAQLEIIKGLKNPIKRVGVDFSFTGYKDFEYYKQKVYQSLDISL